MKKVIRLSVLSLSIFTIVYFIFAKPTQLLGFNFYLAINSMLLIDLLYSIVSIFKKSYTFKEYLFSLLYCLFIIMIMIILYFSFFLSLGFTGNWR